MLSVRFGLFTNNWRFVTRIVLLSFSLFSGSHCGGIGEQVGNLGLQNFRGGKYDSLEWDKEEIRRKKKQSKKKEERKEKSN